jgi:hypothetical protein
LTPPAPDKPPPRNPTGVDLVALILALTLAMGVLLITATSIINVTTHQVPTQALGENTTQILTSVLGGIVGVLGGYVGFKTRPKNDEPPRG